MGDRKSTSESLALRDHAAKCFRLANTLPPGADAEQMRRLALAYLQLAERIDEGVAAAEAGRQRIAALRDPEA